MVVMWLGQDNGTLYENWYPSDQTAWTGHIPLTRETTVDSSVGSPPGVEQVS